MMLRLLIAEMILKLVNAPAASYLEFGHFRRGSMRRL
jgi:hypothetical protein